MRSLNLWALCLGATAAGLSACHKQAAEPRPVEVSEYLNLSKCWLNSNGQFSAFVVFGTGSIGRTPFFISAGCLPKFGKADPKIGFLGATQAIMVHDENSLRLLSKSLGFEVVSNANTDLSYPAADAEVSFLVADVGERATNRNVTFKRVHVVQGMQVGLGQFMRLSPAVRFGMASRTDTAR